MTDSQRIHTHYPQPLARLHRQAQLREGREGLDLGLMLFEGFLHYGTLTGIARLLHETGEIPGAIQLQLVETFERPALGKWWNAARAIDKELRKHGQQVLWSDLATKREFPRVAALARFIDGDTAPPPGNLASAIDRLVNVRNGAFHWMVPPGRLPLLRDPFFDAVEELLLACEPKAQLVAVDQSTNLFKGTEVRFIDMTMNPYRRPGSVLLPTDERPPVGHLYLSDPSSTAGKLVALFPLLVGVHDPENLRRVAWLHTATMKTIAWFEPMGGPADVADRVELEAAARETLHFAFQDEIVELRDFIRKIQADGRVDDEELAELQARMKRLHMNDDPETPPVLGDVIAAVVANPPALPRNVDVGAGAVPAATRELAPTSPGLPPDLQGASELAERLADALGDAAVARLREGLGRTTKTGKVSGQMVNLLLEGLGFQSHDGSAWRLNDKGKPFGFEVTTTDWRGVPISSIRWKPDVEKPLRDEVLQRIGVSQGVHIAAREVHDDWLSATQLGEAMREEISVVGCNLLREALGVQKQDGTVSPQMVNQLLERMGFVVEIGGERHLTSKGARFGEDRAALGRPGIKVLQWSPSTVSELVKHTRDLVGVRELRDAVEESVPTYVNVGELTGARAIGYGLQRFIAGATGETEQTVKRRLNAKRQWKVKYIFNFYDPDVLGAMTVRRALDFSVAPAISEHVGLEEAAVLRRLKKTQGNTRVATLFAAEW